MGSNQLGSHTDLRQQGTELSPRIVVAGLLSHDVLGEGETNRFGFNGWRAIHCFKLWAASIVSGFGVWKTWLTAGQARDVGQERVTTVSNDVGQGSIEEVGFLTNTEFDKNDQPAGWVAIADLSVRLHRCRWISIKRRYLAERFMFSQ